MSGNRGKGRRRFTVDSLFQDTSPRAVGVRDLVDAKEIDINRVVPDPDQPRQTFDEEALEELAASIRSEGVLQPIAVRYDEIQDHYVIVHGERRWRASHLAERKTIPAIVREVPPERRLVQQLMENVVREDLNAVDRAAALRALKSQLDNAPWERVAEAVGIKRSRLFQLLSTEKLADPVQERIRSGELSEKQTRALQGLSPDAQDALANLIVRDGVSESLVREVSKSLRDDPDYLELDGEELRARIDELCAEQRGDPAPGTERSPDERLVEALRILYQDRQIPGDPSQAIERLETRSETSADVLTPGLYRAGIELGKIASSNRVEGANSPSRTQLRALRRLIDMALGAQSTPGR